jgi:hypothetical protein
VPLTVSYDSKSRLCQFILSNYKIEDIKFKIKDLKKASIEVDTLFDYTRTIIEIISPFTKTKCSLWIKNNKYIYEIHQQIDFFARQPKKIRIFKFNESGILLEDYIENLNW